MESAGAGWNTASLSVCLYLRSRSSISRDASLLVVPRCKPWADTPRCCTRCDPAGKTKETATENSACKKNKVLCTSLCSGFHFIKTIVPQSNPDGNLTSLWFHQLNTMNLGIKQRLKHIPMLYVSVKKQASFTSALGLFCIHFVNVSGVSG